MSLLDTYLHLRYKPKRPQFNKYELPPVFKHFDLVLWWPDSIRASRIYNRSPKNILCLANSKTFKLLNLCSSFLRDCTIIVAGEDTNLSVFLEVIDPVIIQNNTIYYEAKDVYHDTIKSFSMGLISYYVHRVGEKFIESQLGRLSDSSLKKQGVLAAWGGIWKHLDEELDDRKSAVEFVNKASWISRELLNPQEYWKRLVDVKYLIAPAGQGVQAPKLAEAWLANTVPIVTRNPCFEDLAEAGFPLVLLDNWGDCTERTLIEYESSRNAIDWKRVEYCITGESFLSKVLK
ncbi:hypothetical protein ACFPK9_08725 [Rubritalea spongiae]|uniref:Glycosyltransferase family 1 protein n=1 Tax=Rubritalea spongiae TaxID=430797 RepID=A0ABW5E5J9_9BACT